MKESGEKPTLAEILEMSKSAKPADRKTALKLFGSFASSIDSTTAFWRIVDFTIDEKPKLRKMAAEVLGNFDNEKLPEILGIIIEDANEPKEVREAAKNSLDRYKLRIQEKQLKPN